VSENQRVDLLEIIDDWRGHSKSHNRVIHPVSFHVQSSWLMEGM
jgi:hypothetical protein